MAKVARIAYNSRGWRGPTGEAARAEAEGTFNNVNGFGYEDWLFRNEWTVDGWRYAFLQGVNKSHARLIRERRPFDVVLFTVRPDRRRQYIATIDDVECLSSEQAANALDAFRENGWLDKMKREVLDVAGNTDALDNPTYAPDILNIRFKLGNARMYPDETFAEPDDPIHLWNRYLLTEALPAIPTMGRAARSGSESIPTAEPHVRAAQQAITVCPEHVAMQARLMRELQQEFPNRPVLRERACVDVQVETDQERWLFEIKTDLSPRAVLRQALGQLLEYAHFATARDGRKLHLVAVGRTPLAPEDAAYLDRLRTDYGLPLDYRVVACAGT